MVFVLDILGRTTGQVQGMLVASNVFKSQLGTSLGLDILSLRTLLRLLQSERRNRRGATDTSI